MLSAAMLWRLRAVSLSSTRVSLAPQPATMPEERSMFGLTRAVSALYQRPWTSNRTEGGRTHDTLDLDHDGSRGAGPRGRRRGAAHPARRRAAQAGGLEPAARGGADLLPHSQPERARGEAEGEGQGTHGH